MRHRFRTELALAVGLAGCVMLAEQAIAIPIELDLAGIVGSTIHFDGAGHFTFTPGGGANQFSITTESGGDGSAAGDLGFMTGTWSFDLAGNVTGSGSLTILGNNGTLTATLTWDAIH